MRGETLCYNTGNRTRISRSIVQPATSTPPRRVIRQVTDGHTDRQVRYRIRSRKRVRISYDLFFPFSHLHPRWFTPHLLNDVTIRHLEIRTDQSRYLRIYIYPITLHSTFNAEITFPVKMSLTLFHYRIWKTTSPTALLYQFPSINF